MINPCETCSFYYIEVIDFIMKMLDTHSTTNDLHVS
jgi:hypothetical protein